MSERFKEHAWKVCVRQKRTEGSNPSLSAIFTKGAIGPLRKDGKAKEDSNPSRGFDKFAGSEFGQERSDWPEPLWWRG